MHIAQRLSRLPRPRRAAGGLFGLLLLLAAGCRTPSGGPDKSAAGASPKPPPVGLPQMGLPAAKTSDDTPLRVNEIAPQRAEGEKEKFILPERNTAGTPEVKIGEYPDKLIKGVQDPDKKIPVQLNFDASPLTEVVEMFSALLTFDYLIDPSLKGAVTMTVDTEMTAREAWELFEHILWLSGAYASRNPGFIHIMPFSKMPQERRLLTPRQPQANVEVAFVPIYNTKSSEIAGLIKPFLTDGATATDIPRLNSLLIVEAPANMAKLRELILRLDAKGEAEWPQVCIPCHQVDVETILEELKALLPVLGLPVSDKPESGGAIKLAALPRLQVIVASAALKEVLDEVERWVRLLDKENTAEQENIFFYNVKHSTADHLNEALGVFFNTSGSTTSKPSQTKSISAKGTPNASRTRRTASSRTPIRNRKSSQQQGQPTTIFDTPLMVYADTEQNRLTIRTTPRAYAMVEALLKRLDIPPRQVMIQAVIAEITLNKSTEFGFTYAARKRLREGSDTDFKAAIVNTAVAATPLVGNVDNGAAFLFKKSDDELAFIKAVAGDTNVRVLSAPQVLATSDQEAVINVGNKVPIITGDYTNTASTSATTGSTYRSIQYEDTGIILTVTPHITAGNEIKIEAKQEVSDAVKTESSGIDSPTIQRRTIETTLVLPDGGTALLGGLIRTRSDKSRNGVPVLMDLPGVGFLFRTNATVSQRTELLILISANIVESETATDRLARRYQTALEEIREKLGL
ncbi:MAG: hypothetical protein GXP31_14255 [Kiritimatiellaeota bacterium]|nr:hypothetical protein [Kiritimatiellota bacterium]